MLNIAETSPIHLSNPSLDPVQENNFGALGGSQQPADILSQNPMEKRKSVGGGSQSQIKSQPEPAPVSLCPSSNSA